MRVLNIVQARMGATRLPGKPLLEVMKRPLLSYQLERLKRCHKVDEIIVATTTHPRDQAIVDFCQQERVSVFRGSEEDVLERYDQAAKVFNADIVIRGTGDCPLIDPAVVDQALEFFLKRHPTYDYVSNILERTYPRGMDVEVFSRASLEQAARNAKSVDEREHVTPYIYQHPETFALGSLVREPNESYHRWTVDTSEDFELISTILKTLYPKNPSFTMVDILQAFKEHPDWIKINAHVQQKPFYAP